MKRIGLCLLFLGAFLACRTTVTEIPEDLLPEEYFRLAQEAILDRGDYNLALRYYQTFQSRFPDVVRRVVEAEYEMALIYYKMDDLETAETLFTRVVERYSQTGAEVLPRWPEVLSRKYLELLTDPE